MQTTVSGSLFPVRYRIMTFNYREPLPEDGQRIHQMVLESGTLDTNSLYLYYLLADHFRDTVVLAESTSGKLHGFVTAYRLPRDPTTLFVWQIAVDRASRGHGIAGKLLDTLCKRPFFREIGCIHCSISPDNTASQKLFARLAKNLQANLQHQPWLSKELLGGVHAREDLYSIDLLSIKPVSGTQPALSAKGNPS